MQTVFYATGVETLDNGKTREHRYTVSANDPAPADHEIVDLRQARVYSVSSVLSRESLNRLKSVALRSGK